MLHFTGLGCLTIHSYHAVKTSKVASKFDLEKLTEYSDRHVIVGVFASKTDTYLARYADVCAALRTTYTCYFTLRPAIMERYPQCTAGTITTFRSKFFTSKHEERIITMPAKGNGASCFLFGGSGSYWCLHV